MEKLINVGVTYGKKYAADLLMVHIELSGHHSEQAGCTREYNKVLGQVRNALEGVGILREEIKNSNYKVTVHEKVLYEKEDDKFYRAAVEIDGYDYEADISVERTADQEEAKAIWQALCSCEDPVGFHFWYDIKDKDTLKTTLLSEVVAEGRRRADILAAAAGTRVVGIHSISYQYDDEGYRRGAAYGVSATYDEAPEFNPRDIYVQCEVKMQWEIEA